jgi:outer membrane receptor protein involved in Fe transport
MWTSKSIRVLAFGFFGVALLTCVPARAQQVEEVVVTAQKKSETLQSVPIAIIAVSAQEIANLNIKDIQGVQLETPGMVFNTDAAFAQAYIRGIGVNFALAGLESPVANYEDDVYAPRTFGGMYDLMDVSDVEVLKGPQGALYGRNATGGAIVINTANPSDKEEGNIYTEFGDYGKEVVSAMVNEPVSDTLKIRVAGRWENQDGYVKNLYNGPLVDGLGESQNGHINLDGYLDDQLRAKVDWKPIDRLDILASTEYTYRRGETTDRTQVDEAPECLLCFLDAIAPLIPQYAIGARPPQGGFYSTLQDVVNSSRVQSIFSTVKTVYNFEDFQLSSITGYRNMVFNGSSDEGGQLGGFLIDHNDDKSHTFSEELRLASEFGGPFNFLSGHRRDRRAQPDQCPDRFGVGLSRGLLQLHRCAEGHGRRPLFLRPARTRLLQQLPGDGAARQRPRGLPGAGELLRFRAEIRVVLPVRERQLLHQRQQGLQGRRLQRDRLWRTLGRPGTGGAGKAAFRGSRRQEQLVRRPAAHHLRSLSLCL